VNGLKLGPMFREPSPLQPSAMAQMRFKSSNNNSLDIKSLWPWLRPYLGLIALGLLCVVLASLSVLGLGQVFRHVIDSGMAESSTAALTRGVGLMVGLIVVLAMASFGRVVLLSAVSEQIIADLRARVMHRLLHADMGWLEKQKTGDLMARLTSDTVLLQLVIGTSLPVALRNSVLLIGGVILMLLSSWKLCLVMVLFAPLILVTLYFVGPRIRRAGQKMQQAVGQMSAQLSESLHAIREIQAFTNEDKQQANFNTANTEIVTVAWRFLIQRGILSASIMAIIFSSIALLLWVGGRDVIAHQISAGALTAFVFYALLVAGSVGALSDIYGDVQRASASLQRLHTLLIAPAITDADTASHPVPDAPQNIRLHNLRFSYPTRPEQVALSIPDLILPLQQQIAFVGPSGAGKTTLFDMLLRFYDPQQGAITLDGVTIRDFNLQAYRRLFALVPQQPSLFSMSIADNIRLNREATSDQVEQAARRAGAHEFIAALSEGYHTQLGERGVRLSGGQAQRLAIARALLHDTRILLLDEATAHLDSETEAQFKEQLRSLRNHMSVFVIAHRLSTIQDSDLIIVIGEGRIVGQGTHDTLLKDCALYQNLCHTQLT
jgi:ATP-binding cassette subfamily B protein